MNLIRKIRESLLSTFLFKILVIKTFNFNLNIRVIKSGRSIINSSNNKLTMILIHF